jgi:hypothetical protein
MDGFLNAKKPPEGGYFKKLTVGVVRGWLRDEGRWTAACCLSGDWDLAGTAGVG